MRYAAYDGCAVLHIGTEAECEDFAEQTESEELTAVPLVAPPMSDAEIQELASCLYDGGWRAEDAEGLREHLDSAYKESEIDTILKAPMDNHDFARLLACLGGIQARYYTVTAEDRDTGVIRWADGSVMTIALNPGDAERIGDGADPVEEGWEDGCGNTVCWENAIHPWEDRGPEHVYAVWDMDSKDGCAEDIWDHGQDREKALSEARYYWGHLTKEERRTRRVLCGLVRAEYFTSDPYERGDIWDHVVGDLLFDSDGLEN